MEYQNAVKKGFRKFYWLSFVLVLFFRIRSNFWDLGVHFFE